VWSPSLIIPSAEWIFWLRWLINWMYSINFFFFFFYKQMGFPNQLNSSRSRPDHGQLLQFGLQTQFAIDSLFDLSFLIVEITVFSWKYFYFVFWCFRHINIHVQVDTEALIEIERHRSIQDSRKFYKRLNDVRWPLEPQVAMCTVKTEVSFWHLLRHRNSALASVVSTFKVSYRVLEMILWVFF
jgi:hypothetical protein